MMGSAGISRTHHARGTAISSAREWDEMEPRAVPSHPIPLQALVRGRLINAHLHRDLAPARQRDHLRTRHISPDGLRTTRPQRPPPSIPTFPTPPTPPSPSHHLPHP